jgi:hypothetical protein
VEEDSLIDDIAEEVLTDADLVVHELDIVDDERDGRLPRGLARAPLKLAPQRKIRDLLLGLDDGN